MSADTFTTAMFLITAVIAAGVLISAIFPVVYQMAGTFSSAGHASDVQLRTTIEIIKDVAFQNQNVKVWLKNTGSEQIPLSDIQRSDVICGDAGNFGRLSLVTGGSPGPSNPGWSYTLYDLNNNNIWDPGETLEIDAYTTTINPADPVYFQFSLPNGITSSDQFPVSTTP